MGEPSELSELLELWQLSLLLEELFTLLPQELSELSELLELSMLLEELYTLLPLVLTPLPPLATVFFTEPMLLPLLELELDTTVMCPYLLTLAAKYAECKYTINQLE